MSKTVNEVVSYFENLYNNKAIYCWGLNGEIINKTTIDKAYNLYKSTTYNRAYYDKKLLEGQGKIGADCSGAMYPVSGFDTTAKNYYNKCIDKGDINTIQINKACLVFKGKSVDAISHIGFYCGNGYVIEMKSSKDNCVKDKLENHGWKWWGIPSWINYDTSIIPKTSSVKAVDVSSYQGNINWENVKASGIKHAILKVIRKDLTPDKQFENNWNGCAKAKVDVIGVYNYSYATTKEKAKIDAQKVLSVLNGRKTKIWLDVEDKCQQGLGSLLIEIINEYQDVIEKSGYEFGVYTGMSFYKSFIKPYKNMLKCKTFWIARYYNGYNKMDLSVNPNEQFNPCKNIGLSEIYAWQYTSSGQVCGINGNVDVSMVYSIKESSPSTPSVSAPSLIETSDIFVGKVNTKSSDLNVRNSPSKTAPIVKKYKKGEIVQILSRCNNWYKTDSGYVSADYIINAVGEVCNCYKLNLRSSAFIQENVISVLTSGDQVYLLKDENGWYKVKTMKNIIGYISKKYTRIL